MVDAAGTVNVDGQPLEKGGITFTPVDGQSNTAGADIVAGKYATRVPPGSFKVSISAPKVVGQTKLYDTPDSPVRDVIEEALPAKYNTATELVKDIKEDTTSLNFDLSTKP
jgi:hypothetical protein